MKRIICTLASFTIACIGFSQLNHKTVNYWPNAVVVTAVENDMIYMEDCAGFVWSVYDDYGDVFVGDMYSLLMDDNGTEEIFDDKVVGLWYTSFEVKRNEQIHS